MKRTLSAYAAAAILAISVAAPAAQAMEQELNAVTGAVYNSLNNMQMDLTNIQSLRLSDIQRINSIMHGGDTESQKRNKINNILRQAGEG